MQIEVKTQQGVQDSSREARQRRLSKAHSSRRYGVFYAYGFGLWLPFLLDIHADWMRRSKSRQPRRSLEASLQYLSLPSLIPVHVDHQGRLKNASQRLC